MFFLSWKIPLLHFPAPASLKTSVTMFLISESSFLFCMFKIVSCLVSLDTIPPFLSPRLLFLSFELFLFCFLLFNASSFLQVPLSLSVLASACHILTFPPSLVISWQAAHNPAFLWTGPCLVGIPARSEGLPKHPRILSPMQGALPTSRAPGLGVRPAGGPGPSRHVGATLPCALCPVPSAHPGPAVGFWLLP